MSRVNERIQPGPIVAFQPSSVSGDHFIGCLLHRIAALGLTRKAAAAQMGVPLDAVANILAHRNSPQPYLLKAARDKLGVEC